MSRHTTFYGKDSVVERIEFGLRSPGKLFTRGVTILLAMMICGYLLTVFASGFVLKYFALNPQEVLNGKIWMLLTFPFISGGCGLIFNGLTLLFIGSAFEHKRGTGGLILLWLISSIICAVI